MVDKIGKLWLEAVWKTVSEYWGKNRRNGHTSKHLDTELGSVLELFYTFPELSSRL